jgi:hypothetical protein
MNLVRVIASYIATHRFFWFFFKPFAKAGAYMVAHRAAVENERSRRTEEERYDKLFSQVIESKVVLNGPFKGMRYPKTKSIGSALYPKLIGSYERELHGVVERICSTGYTEIINIGCGEGYYAVGLARRIPSATIFAFDIEPEAMRLTKEMALLNGAEKQIQIGAFCSPNYLGNFPFTRRGLIVCDCEGFELQLFNAINLENLKSCDMLIETHDFIDINISTYMLDLFSKTHDVLVVKSIDDLEKAKTYQFYEAASFSLSLRKALFAEGRPAIMEWLFLTARNTA